MNSQYVRAVCRQLPGIFITTALFLICNAVLSQPTLVADEFENGLEHWILSSKDSGAIKVEPNQDNHILELRPKDDQYSHILLAGSETFENVKVEGNFLFPTAGDGYLGFIYNFAENSSRTDFGCIYIKSNGNYVRASPHYDGNPSWRLYEEFRVNLINDDRILPLQWYSFRLEVRGRNAKLFIGKSRTPVISFDLSPRKSGAIGFEARPLGGDPVWLDDVRVSELGASEHEVSDVTARSDTLYNWQVAGPFDETSEQAEDVNEISSSQWRNKELDPRGALISASETQYLSGTNTILYARAQFDVEAGKEPRSIAISSANQLDIWVNGIYRGTVAPDDYIWRDHVTSAEHQSARLSVRPLKVGTNYIVFRIDGERFAGGGFFAALRKN